MGARLAQSGRITPVILSGGAGTRLWPLSLQSRPKQFLPLLNGRSTFEDTLERIADTSVFAPPIVVTGQQFNFQVADELQRAGMAGHIVLEPMRRDSAAAIAVAAALSAEMNGPSSLLLVLAADHLVKDKQAFVATALAGAEAARQGCLVTFGIKPDKPATGYGYIAPGKPVDAEVRQVARFVEKPNAASAAELISQGCLWNSGNFLFRADILLEELLQFEPGIHKASTASAKTARVEKLGSMTSYSLAEAEFGANPSKSIDFAVMEKTERAAVIAADYDWSDLGSWDALWEVSAKDDAGNVVHGPVTLTGTSTSFISSSGTRTAVVGLSNIAVIVTDDIVLVGPRHMAAELKPLAAKFEEAERQEAVTGGRAAAGKTT